MERKRTGGLPTCEESGPGGLFGSCVACNAKLCARIDIFCPWPTVDVEPNILHGARAEACTFIDCNDEPCAEGVNNHCAVFSKFTAICIFLPATESNQRERPQQLASLQQALAQDTWRDQPQTWFCNLRCKSRTSCLRVHARVLIDQSRSSRTQDPSGQLWRMQVLQQWARLAPRRRRIHSMRRVAFRVGVSREVDEPDS